MKRNVIAIKNILLTVSFAIMLLGNATVSADNGELAPPKQVVVVCRNQAGVGSAAMEITTRIERHFHTPLASILPVYSIVPERAIKFLPAVKGKVDAAWVRELAALNNADIAVVAELAEYRTYIRYSYRDDDAMQYSAVSVRYHIFDRSKKDIFSDRLSDIYEGSMSSNSSPEYLLNAILDRLEARLIKEIPFKPQEVLTNN